MCGERGGHGYGYHNMGHRSQCMCGCSGHDSTSTETKVKYLEAMKSKLEDRINNIDQEIEKIQKANTQEA